MNFKPKNFTDITMLGKLFAAQILARYIKSLQIKFLCNQHSAEIHRFTLGFPARVGS